jgi:hypothetical protein
MGMKMGRRNEVSGAREIARGEEDGRNKKLGRKQGGGRAGARWGEQGVSDMGKTKQKQEILCENVSLPSFRKVSTI